jgi:hypothetical protein
MPNYRIEENPGQYAADIQFSLDWREIMTDIHGVMEKGD